MRTCSLRWIIDCPLIYLSSIERPSALLLLSSAITREISLAVSSLVYIQRRERYPARTNNNCHDDFKIPKIADIFSFGVACGTATALLKTINFVA
jgi:hypothetical protein